MIHRLQRHGDRGYGKARTACGLDAKGQIHPLAEVWTDGKQGDDPKIEPKCAACWVPYEEAVAESRSRAGYATVHVLYHGLPLCGYGEGKAPGEWPADQAWLSVLELGSHRYSGKNRPNWCAACLEKARVGDLPEVAKGTNALDHMREPKRDGIRRFEVWSLRTIGNGGVDLRVGEAIENRDGTISVQLPALGVRLKLKST